MKALDKGFCLNLQGVEKNTKKRYFASQGTGDSISGCPKRRSYRLERDGIGWYACICGRRAFPGSEFFSGSERGGGTGGSTNELTLSHSVMLRGGLVGWSDFTCRTEKGVGHPFWLNKETINSLLKTWGSLCSKQHTHVSLQEIEYVVIYRDSWMFVGTKNMVSLTLHMTSFCWTYVCLILSWFHRNWTKSKGTRKAFDGTGLRTTSRRRRCCVGNWKRLSKPRQASCYNLNWALAVKTEEYRGRFFQFLNVYFSSVMPYCYSNVYWCEWCMILVSEHNHDYVRAVRACPRRMDLLRSKWPAILLARRFGF